MRKNKFSLKEIISFTFLYWIIGNACLFTAFSIMGYFWMFFNNPIDILFVSTGIVTITSPFVFIRIYSA